MGMELLKFTSVKRWISSLEQSAASKGKQLTEKTRNNLLWHLLKFTQNTGLNPDELLKEAQTDIEKTMNRLTSYFNEQQKGKNDKKGVSFLRGFYTHNDIIFSKLGAELLKFSSVKRWISSLEQSAVSRGKQLTESTRDNRLWHLQKYVDSANLNPDELLNEAKTDIEKTMARLTNHFNEQQKPKNNRKGVDWNTACTSISFLRGFYTHNDIIFPKRYKSPQRRVSKVSKSDSKTEMYSYNEETDDIVFENGYLKQFISNLSFRDQTIAICLLATGADTADLFKLSVGFVRDGKGGVSNQKRFFWHDNRTKDNIPFKVFFSEEATQYLKRYVEQERADAKSDELIFLKEDGEALPVHALAMNFRCAAQKMGFAKDDNEKSNPFRPKRFRHIFRTACSNANIDAGFIMAFMGHASTVSAGYLEKSNGLFLNAYVKVEPYITVFGIDKSQIIAVNETVADLKQSTEELKSQIVAKDAEVRDLTERIKTVEAMKTSIEEIQSTFLEFYQAMTSKDGLTAENFDRIRKVGKKLELSKKAEKKD